MKKLGLILLICLPLVVMAQEDFTENETTINPCEIELKDTNAVVKEAPAHIATKYKNTIRYNLTNNWIFGTTNRVFGYERVVKPFQSFSVNIGFAAFPEFGGRTFDSVDFNRGSKAGGFNFAGDYRFYLSKENRHSAPRGVYLAPFTSFTYMHRTNSLDVNFSNGSQFSSEFKNEFTAILLGGALGYQFLFYKDRIALDLILLGTGIGWYKYKGEIVTDLNGNENYEGIKDQIKDYLSDRFPSFNNLIDGNGIELNKTGYTTDFAFRYVMHIGYRF